MANKESGNTTRILMGVPLGLHFVWFSFMGMGIWRMFSSFCQEAMVRPSVQDAAVDRIDIVATCLAMLAVVIGIAAIGGFILVRREAIGAAEDVAKAQIPLLVTEYLEKTQPDLLQDLVVIAIKANPDLIRQALRVDSDSDSAKAYPVALVPDQELSLK